MHKNKNVECSTNYHIKYNTFSDWTFYSQDIDRKTAGSGFSDLEPGGPSFVGIGELAWL